MGEKKLTFRYDFAITLAFILSAYPIFIGDRIAVVLFLLFAFIVELIISVYEWKCGGSS